MAAETKKTVTRPQVVLYGVAMVGDYRAASIVNPGRSLHKGERETMNLKVGERIGEYKLAKILPDRIMMEGAEDSFEVLLYDPKMPKKRMEVRTESKPAPTKTPQPALAPPTPGSPVLTPPLASAVATKPAETVQEKVATPPRSMGRS